ncbi:MAG TPA: RcpC/CpaB family pilus assembly protein [Solirubrobacteraceae bacterium]|nr:RcpC/CpaB family pilus assembly protein [Solirubrobacteraceae bacterium]
MSRRRRAAILLGLALVLGGLAASDVARREAAVRAQLGPAVQVVVARADLAAGRPLRARDLAIRRVPGRYAPVGAATLPEMLIGQRLATPVARGGYMGTALIATEQAVKGPPVRKGERAAEVIVLGPRSLVVPGARVDVLVTRDGESGAAAGTELALEDVEVLAARAAPPTAPADTGERVAATLRVSVRDAVYLTAAQSFARELRLLPRVAGDTRRAGPIAVGPGLH